jgi:hypothetical protein
MRGKRLRIAVVAAAVTSLVPVTIAVAGSSAAPASPAGVLGPPVSTVDPAGVLGGGPIRGMILNDFGKSPKPAMRDFQRLKAMGVNTVVAGVYVHMASPSSDWVGITADTVKDAVLYDVASKAHSLGMAFEIVPTVVVDSGHSPGSNFFWRGGIAPRHPSTWWHYYNAMITHYTIVANNARAEILSTGSELVSMQGYVTNWEHLLAWVNKHYHGLTTYMSTGNGIMPTLWLGSLDIIGTSAYYSISTDKHPKVSEMAYTWKHAYLPGLYNLYRKFHKRIFINEIGYCSVLYTAAHPAIAYQSSDPANQQSQANAYQALLQAIQGENWLRGVAWWHWDKIGNPVIDRGYSMRDKKAECVIAHYWARENPSLPAPVDTTADACFANHLQTAAGV